MAKEPQTKQPRGAIATRVETIPGVFSLEVWFDCLFELASRADVAPVAQASRVA